jgi:hypothetical protein
VRYEIQLVEEVEMVERADAYVQEGVLTTFCQGRHGRAVTPVVELPTAGREHSPAARSAASPHDIGKQGKTRSDVGRKEVLLRRQFFGKPQVGAVGEFTLPT